MSLDMTPEFWDRLARREDRAWALFCAEFKSLIVGIPCWVRWKFTKDVREEVSQQIGAALSACIDELRGQQAVAGFIKRIAVNKCIDQVRRQVRERKVMVDVQSTREPDAPPVDYADPEKRFDPVREVEADERARELHQMLEQLDPTCREAIRLFYLKELKYNDISAKLNITVNTVGSRLNKCLAKFTGLMKKSPFFREYFPKPSDGEPREQP